MTDDSPESGDTFEFTASKAMWYSGALPDAGLVYLALYLLLQIIVVPFRWLKRGLATLVKAIGSGRS